MENAGDREDSLTDHSANLRQAGDRGTTMSGRSMTSTGAAIERLHRRERTVKQIVQVPMRAIADADAHRGDQTTAFVKHLMLATWLADMVTLRKPEPRLLHNNFNCKGSCGGRFHRNCCSQHCIGVVGLSRIKPARSTNMPSRIGVLRIHECGHSVQSPRWL